MPKLNLELRRGRLGRFGSLLAILTLTFIAYLIAVVLHEVLQEDRVTTDTIAGGITVYLLFGVGYGEQYLLGWVSQSPALLAAADRR